MTADDDIAGLVLAGGEGRRMGGVDKGLVPWRGRPLAGWVVAAMAQVVTPVIVSANRSLDHYQALSTDLVEDDDRYRWQGPLAGLLSGLRRARELGCVAVVVAPCDTPELEPGLVARLCQSWREYPLRPVYSLDRGRAHPLHGVFPVLLEEPLNRWLSRGERRVYGFVHEVGGRGIDCGGWPRSFRNRNRPEDLES